MRCAAAWMLSTSRSIYVPVVRGRDFFQRLAKQTDISDDIRKEEAKTRPGIRYGSDCHMLTRPKLCTPTVLGRPK